MNMSQMRVQVVLVPEGVSTNVTHYWSLIRVSYFMLLETAGLGGPVITFGAFERLFIVVPS